MKTRMIRGAVIANCIVGALFFFTPHALAVQEHVSCKALKSDLNKQINSLRKHQAVELAQCHKNNKGSQDCDDLKTQQESKLNQLRKDRETQLANCHSRKKAASSSADSALPRSK